MLFRREEDRDGSHTLRREHSTQSARGNDTVQGRSQEPQSDSTRYESRDKKGKDPLHSFRVGYLFAKKEACLAPVLLCTERNIPLQESRSCGVWRRLFA